MAASSRLNINDDKLDDRMRSSDTNTEPDSVFKLDLENKVDVSELYKESIVYEEKGEANRLLPVREINWVDNKIQRSGIIPIYDDGKYKWIGLGVNTFSANITTIGGVYESSDYDLLSTAVREYNEEIGENLSNIVDESVYNLWAIKSDYSIAIFLPILHKPQIFRETEELYTILWVTPQQLITMVNNQDYIMPNNYGTTRMFAFSHDLKKLAINIAKIVESGYPFKFTQSDGKLYRPKMQTIINEPKISTDIDEFNHDILSNRNWYNIALVVGTQHIGIMKQNRTLYILPKDKSDIIFKGINKVALRIIVADNRSLYDPIIQNSKLSQNLLTSIEIKGEQLRSSREILSEFIKYLNKIRTASIDPIKILSEFNQKELDSENDRIIRETTLILDYEAKIYKLIQQQKGFFNVTRACFLEGINRINNILKKYEGLPFMTLVSMLGKIYNCKNPNNHKIVSILLNVGFIQQDKLTTNVFIPF